MTIITKKKLDSKKKIESKKQIYSKKHIHSKKQIYSKTQIYNTEDKYSNTDKINNFINNNLKKLEDGKIFKNELLNNIIFNPEDKNCICKNIFKLHINDNCNCNDLKTYTSQGRSGASIHSLQCNNVTTILKVVKLENYYLKLRTQTNNYNFIECDNFTLQTLINLYIYNELPNNTIKIINYGICQKQNDKDKAYGSYYGYNLMNEADLGDGYTFIINLINGKYDEEFKIINEEIRYMFVINYLLQSTLIIGHLQSSLIELFHGDYKPNNVFIKKTSTKQTRYFNFTFFGKKMKIKNLGFSVLIADFDKSSITINTEINSLSNNKHRLIPPIILKPLLGKYVNDLIQQYGDLDPDVYEGDIKLNKLFISNFIPLGKDPTIHILRSAGIKLYRDFDLYTFMVKLLDDMTIRNYVKKHKIDTTILSFMSPKFKNYIFNKLPSSKSLSETVYIIVDVLDKINEPMNRIFCEDYYKTLKLLNYKLFKL